MNTEQRMVQEFHEKYNCPSRNTLKMPDADMMLLRSRLIMEEAAEFVKATSLGDMVELVDAICDLLYVTYGAAVVIGVDIEPIFAEVQKANMTKDGGGHDEAGKVQKGPHFQEPDIIGELKKQGWDNASTT